MVAAVIIGTQGNAIYSFVSQNHPARIVQPERDMVPRPSAPAYQRAMGAVEGSRWYQVRSTAARMDAPRK
jgi:hypothetical protein